MDIHLKMDMVTYEAKFKPELLTFPKCCKTGVNMGLLPKT